jgi:hypothetical protein
LATQRVFLCGSIIDVDLEGFGDTVGCDLELLGIVWCDRAVGLRSLEKVEDGERKALLRLLCGRL